MASKEMAIFHKSQWLEGTLYGAEATDSNTIKNKLKVLNDDSLELPVRSDFSESIILEEYSSFDIEGNKINLKVKKEDAEKALTEDNFMLAESTFKKNNIAHELDYISVKFDWEALKTNHKENAYIEFLDSASSVYRLILTNQSEIKMSITDGVSTTEFTVEDSAVGSIGQITSIITNNLADFFVDLRLDYDETEAVYYLESRLRCSGYESIWYRAKFGANKISKMRLVQPANNGTNSIVDKELNIKEIYAEGFNETTSYESKIFDAGENASVWENLTLSGTFPEAALIDDGSNSITIDVFASDNTETIESDMSRSINLVPTEKDFTISNELEEELQELKGRYLKLKINISNSKNYQNSIDYFKLEYLLPSEQSGYVQKEVTESSTSRIIGQAGGVISLDTEYFPVSLYIPEGALTADETITIRRVASSEEKFADDIIGFEFGPEGLQFLKPAMLEVDYSSFNFNSYQSESGLKLAYLDNTEPEELSTVVDELRNKAISYIEHFSTYGIMATDNLYSPRTKMAATKLPRWMDVRKKESNFQQILNHGVFTEVEDAGSKYYKLIKNYFLDTADTSMKSIAFKTRAKNFKNGEDTPLIANTEQFKAKYKGKYIPITFDEKKYYNSKDELCYFNLKTEVIYFSDNYGRDLKIIDLYNDITYSLEANLKEHKIWNVFDEFALLFDMERNEKETNEELKERILDYGINPGDSTVEGLRNHIARELSLTKDEVNVNSLSDDSYLNELKKADGSASERLLSISSYINNHLNVYWDQWVWDEGYWNIENQKYSFVF